MSRAPIDWKKVFMGTEDHSLRFFSPGDREGSLLVQPPKQVFEDGDLDWRLALVGQFIGSALNFGAMQKVVDMLWGKVSKVKIGLSYIASALGNPLYMDSVTSNRERLEYAKVCVEIGACSSIPKFIDVLLCDGRVHPVRVVVPWLLPSCSKCKVFGHSKKTCSVKEVRITQVWRQKAHVVNDGLFTTCEHGESLLQGVVSAELVVPIVEGVVSFTNVLSAQDVVVVKDASEGEQIETGGAAGQLVCEKRVDVPVDEAVLGIDAEEQVDVPVGGAAMEVDADADFPTLQASVHKKKGRGRPAKEKKMPSQVVFAQDLKNKKKAAMDIVKLADTGTAQSVVGGLALIA
ncbi:hypothetical protein V6N13_096591 [Hibiscus sabdariffa]